jgi:hypothetical protein
VTSTEAICTAIIGGFTILGGAVRWSAHVFKGVAARVVRAIDDSTAAWTKTSETVSALTQKLVSLEAKIDVQKQIEQAVDAVVDEVSGVHEAAAAQKAAEDRRPSDSRATPAGGYSVVNPRRRGA